MYFSVTIIYYFSSIRSKQNAQKTINKHLYKLLIGKSMKLKSLAAMILAAGLATATVTAQTTTTTAETAQKAKTSKCCGDKNKKGACSEKKEACGDKKSSCGDKKAACGDKSADKNCSSKKESGKKPCCSSKKQ